MYEFYSDASETVTIGTAGVQARIDIICLKVDASTGVASIVAVAGTPSGSPAVPATPASHYKLAEIAVGISVTTITDANITDTRRSVFVAPTGARNQGLINGKIVPTVASNNLTVAIKTLSDTDPSATNPVGIWIGNNLRWITSSLSVTANGGSNWFNSGSAELATREIDYFVYIGFKSSDSTLKLGWMRLPYARVKEDYNSATASNEKYAIGVDQLGAGDNVVNIGRFAATLSAAASHNWSVPSFTNANLIQEPFYETRWLPWTPVYTGSGSMTWTSVTASLADYKITNNQLSIRLDATGTTGGTASTELRATVPMAVINNHVFGSSVRDATSGSGVAGWGYMSTAGRIHYLKIDSSNYGLGAGRFGSGHTTYRI